MKVVTPYRPFAPESPSHRKLGAFDWVAAIRMLTATVAKSCRCDTIALTDYDSILPVPALHFQTVATRLMVWIVEVSLAYVESAHFDEDTVFVSPDTLVLRDLRPYFAGDLTILVRTDKKYHNRPVINAVQWWPVRSKDRLIQFYRDVLAIADALPEPLATWGADSESIRQRLEPLRPGLHERAGVIVSMREAVTVMSSISQRDIRELALGRRVRPPEVAVIDFKGPDRKRAMAAYFAGLPR